MTDAERRLWFDMRDRRLAGYKFRRQHPIEDFVVDFACTKHHLVVEADGGQHADNEKDGRRTAKIEALDWRVLRFWNHDILANTEGVILTILRELEFDRPSPASGLCPSAPSPAMRERA
jgi:very-short-patch-repair endonuclease